MVEEWMAERQAKVAEFDRLVGKGLPVSKVARALGSTTAGIRVMRQTVEQVEETARTGLSGGERIDLGLALLTCLRKPGERLTARDIAAWCGCSHRAIQNIERRALAKVRQRLLDAIREPEMAAEVEGMLVSFAEAA